MSEEELIKIHIDLPNHWATGGESMWAKPLGDNLYQIENVPFFAYGLNYLDIVRAESDSAERQPEIKELITPSGHRTFRVIFRKHIERQQQDEVLNSLKEFSISYERASANSISLDMQPSGDYQSVFDQLDELLKEDILGFETCEERVSGSFDDVPEN